MKISTSKIIKSAKENPWDVAALVLQAVSLVLLNAELISIAHESATMKSKAEKVLADWIRTKDFADSLDGISDYGEFNRICRRIGVRADEYERCVAHIRKRVCCILGKGTKKNVSFRRYWDPDKSDYLGFNYV